MKFLVPTGRTILQNNGREVMAEAVHDCHQYANLRCDPCDDDRIYTKHPKGLVKVGFEESTETPLRQNDIFRLGLQIIYYLCTLRPPKGVDIHPSLEDEISLQETVAGKDDWELSLPSLFYELLQVWDDGLSLAIIGVPGAFP